MATSENARQRAITATWVATIGAGAPDDEGLDQIMRLDPAVCIELLGDDRHPVRVSVRPAEDLPRADPLGSAGRPDQPTRPPADLYHGPALAREALRRVFEADRAELFDRSADTGPAAYRAPDGVLVTHAAADLYGEHMRATAYVLAELAAVAARLGPDRPDRDEWAAALSAVHALTPDDSEDPALDHSSHSLQWVGGCPECPPAAPTGPRVIAARDWHDGLEYATGEQAAEANRNAAAPRSLEQLAKLGDAVTWSRRRPAWADPARPIVVRERQDGAS